MSVEDSRSLWGSAIHAWMRTIAVGHDHGQVWESISLIKEEVELYIYNDITSLIN